MRTSSLDAFTITTYARRRGASSTTPPRALHSSTATPLAILHPKSVPSHTSHAAPEGGEREGRFRSVLRREAADDGEETRDAHDRDAPPSVSRFKHVSSRESTMSTISGCRPMGAATKCAIPGCFAAASAASVGMSSCQCLPGERKNGLTATVVAPCSTHLPKACSMSGSAISMCASSTIGRPVWSLYILTNSSSRSFEAFRLDPWSTMTTPITSSAAEARVHDDGPPRPRARYRDRRDPARRRAKRHGAWTAAPARRMVT